MTSRKALTLGNDGLPQFIQTASGDVISGVSFGFPNVADYGAVYDNTTDGSTALTNALSALATLGGGTLGITGQIYLNPAAATTFTVPANVDFRFTPRGRIKLGAKATLTVVGRVNAGAWQVFDTSAGGTVTFGASNLNPTALPEWWGAVPDNATDSTAALQAAINAVIARGAGEVVLDGQYVTSSVVLLNSNGIVLRGTGATAARIRTTSATGNIVTIQPPTGVSVVVGCGVERIQFSYGSGTTYRNQGTYGVLISKGVNSFVKDCFFDHMGTCIGSFGCANSLIDHNDMQTQLPTNGIGIEISGDVGTQVRHNNIDNPAGSEIAYCVLIHAAANGVYFTQNNGGHASYGLYMAADTADCVNNFFVQDSWDSCTQSGVALIASNGHRVNSNNFQGVWAASNSAHGFYTATDGSTGAQVASNQFTGCLGVNNVGHGWCINAGTSDIVLTGCIASGNGRGTNGKQFQGCYIAPNVSHVNITGGVFRPTGNYGGTQNYGILVDTGSSDFLIITGVDGSYNNTKGCQNNGSGTNSIIQVIG